MDNEITCDSCGSIFQIHRVENCADDEIVCCPFCMSMDINNGKEEDDDYEDNSDEEEED